MDLLSNSVSLSHTRTHTRTQSSVLTQTGFQFDRVIMTSHSEGALGWKVRVIDPTQEEIYQCPKAQLWQEPNPLRAQCSNCSDLLRKHTPAQFRGAASKEEGQVMGWRGQRPNSDCLNVLYCSILTLQFVCFFGVHTLSQPTYLLTSKFKLLMNGFHWFPGVRLTFYQSK